MQKYTTNNIITQVVFDKNFNEAKSHKDILSMYIIMKEAGFDTKKIEQLLTKVSTPITFNDKILRLYYLLLHNKTNEINMSCPEIFETFLEKALFRNQIENKEINSLVTKLKNEIKKDGDRKIFKIDLQRFIHIFESYQKQLDVLYMDLYDVDAPFDLAGKEFNILQKNVSLTIFYGIVKNEDKPIVKTMLKIWRNRHKIEHKKKMKNKRKIPVTFKEYKKVIMLLNPTVEDDFNSKFDAIVKEVQE